MVGLDQLTTPVALLIVMPLGLAIRVQVIGNVPCNREGVGPVYGLPS